MHSRQWIFGALNDPDKNVHISPCSWMYHPSHSVKWNKKDCVYPLITLSDLVSEASPCRKQLTAVTNRWSCVAICRPFAVLPVHYNHLETDHCGSMTWGIQRSHGSSWSLSLSLDTITWVLRTGACVWSCPNLSDSGDAFSCEWWTEVLVLASFGVCVCACALRTAPMIYNMKAHWRPHECRTVIQLSCCINIESNVSFGWGMLCYFFFVFALDALIGRGSQKVGWFSQTHALWLFDSLMHIDYHHHASVTYESTITGIFMIWNLQHTCRTNRSVTFLVSNHHSI